MSVLLQRLKSEKIVNTLLSFQFQISLSYFKTVSVSQFIRKQRKPATDKSMQKAGTGKVKA